MPAPQLTIGHLARAANCRVETVYYYEKTGLMRAPARTEGGHRLYHEDDSRRLRFIRRCRELGFTIDQIRTLLGFIDEPNHSCGEVRTLARAQMREIEDRIADLRRLSGALEEMVGQCKESGYPVEKCPIINALFEEGGA